MDFVGKPETWEDCGLEKNEKFKPKKWKRGRGQSQIKGFLNKPRKTNGVAGFWALWWKCDVPSPQSETDYILLYVCLLAFATCSYFGATICPSGLVIITYIYNNI